MLAPFHSAEQEACLTPPRDMERGRSLCAPSQFASRVGLNPSWDVFLPPHPAIPHLFSLCPPMDNENLKICFKKKICLKISKKTKVLPQELAPGVFGMQLLCTSVALSAASQWRDAIKCCPSGECKLCSRFHSVAHVLDWELPVSVPHLKLCLSQIPLPMSH